MGTIATSIRKIKVGNITTWLIDQLRQPEWLDNLLLSRHSWGAFSIYSHCYRSNGLPKKVFATRELAQKAADSMGRKRGMPFAVYKCLFCEGWHISKIGDNKVLSAAAAKNMDEVVAPIKNMNRHDCTCLDMDKALATGIPDIHPAYGGLRGRTLSSSRQLHAWKTLVEAGLKQVIDLRADYNSNFYSELCGKTGVEYFHYPVAIQRIEEMVDLFPRLCELIDRGSFYIACAMGLHRTDIALCLYWVFYAADRGVAPPPLQGYRMDKGLGTDKIMRALNAFYKLKAERDGKVPIPFEIFKERKDIIKELNRNDNPF